MQVYILHFVVNLLRGYFCGLLSCFTNRFEHANLVFAIIEGNPCHFVHGKHEAQRVASPFTALASVDKRQVHIKNLVCLTDFNSTSDQYSSLAEIPKAEKLPLALMCKCMRIFTGHI